MSGQATTQAEVEFVAYVRTRGPFTVTEATEYVRLNNLHEPAPYTLTLTWLKKAIEEKTLTIYRDGLGVLLYGMPNLKKFKQPAPPRPIQTDLARKAPPTTAQLAAQAAALATLADQPNNEKEKHE